MVSAEGSASTEKAMHTLLSFFKDLFKAITSPGAPLPDGSCCLERHTRLK
jgi:hypothetical protein